MIRRGEIPEAWEQARRVVVERLDDITNALDRGFKSRSQFRDVREVEIDTGALPVDVLVRGTTPPLSVLCLRAVESDRSSDTVVSGAPVLWSWRNGAVRIEAIGTLDASTQYLVTLAVVE